MDVDCTDGQLAEGVQHLQLPQLSMRYAIGVCVSLAVPNLSLRRFSILTNDLSS